MSLRSSSNVSLHHRHCVISRTSISISTALVLTYDIPLLPLFIFVLYVGYQRWRKQRSVAMATTTSHLDVFTFNMIVLETISISGSFLYAYAMYTNQPNVMAAGLDIFSIISPGQTLFHLLTCVERYLAVVHPITYLGLRQAGGIWIRNISIGCVWLMTFGSLIISIFIEYFYIIFFFLLLGFSTIVISFCSLSVLCVLIRPGPGEVGRNRGQVDESKQRAFYTIVTVMGALLLRLLSSLVSTALYVAPLLSYIDFCLIDLFVNWFCLPSSLVLPLLFLQRAGKLPECKHNTVSA